MPNALMPIDPVANTPLDRPRNMASTEIIIKISLGCACYGEW